MTDTDAAENVYPFAGFGGSTAQQVSNKVSAKKALFHHNPFSSFPFLSSKQQFIQGKVQDYSEKVKWAQRMGF